MESYYATSYWDSQVSRSNEIILSKLKFHRIRFGNRRLQFVFSYFRYYYPIYNSCTRTTHL